MDVAGVALALVVLRHEGERVALLGGDLLGARLVDGVPVAGDEGLVVLEGDLVLAGVALALGGLDGESGGGHLVADAAQEGFDATGTEDGVVDVVLVGGGEAAVVRVPGLLVAVVEDDELELGADVGGEAVLGEALQLAAEDLAGAATTGLPSAQARSAVTMAVASFQGRWRRVARSGCIAKSP